MKDAKNIGWIVLGACSSDPDVYPGVPVEAGKTVEWQVSDGPAGQRGSSSDFLDPLAVLDDLHKAGGAGYDVVGFMAQNELEVFKKACLDRANGVAVIELDHMPGADWFEPELAEYDLVPFDWRAFREELSVDWDAWAAEDMKTKEEMRAVRDTADADNATDPGL